MTATADNTSRFTGRTDVYDRYRQRYPTQDIIATLRLWCRLQPDWLIADIGAGTGMLSEVFLANSNPVIAIEPNEEMRTPLASLTTKYPLLKVLEGTAESTGLANNSVDIVAAGRAFHWFETQPALTEFRRILKPQGWLVLASLGRSKDQTAQSLAFEQLLSTHGTDYAYVRASYRVHEDFDNIFASDSHNVEFRGEQQLDWQAYLGQSMSLSMTPQQDDPRFPAFESALRDHFTTYAAGNIITIQTTCWLNAGRL